MAFWQRLRLGAVSKSRFQDIIFLIGIFVFSTILIVGLFPRGETEKGVGTEYFLFLMMSVPVIAAIYFIIVSFRRKLYAGSADVGSSIRFKIALAFVFVAIMPSLPIVIISNNIINHTIAELITEKTSDALEESIRMAHEEIIAEHENVRRELAALDSLTRSGVLGQGEYQRRKLAHSFASRGYRLLFLRLESSGERGNRLSGYPWQNMKDSYAAGVLRLLSAVEMKKGVSVYSISVSGSSMIAGTVLGGGSVITLYRILPQKVFERISLYEETLRKYRQREFLKPYLQTGMGVFLLLLSILIIAMAIGVSYLLSRGITRPVLEMAEAAHQVASGDFSVQLRRDSSDEIALLFKSFNQMTRQLEESRKVMYQTQKLQAWREMARKLVHEIKNPLTPIRLSAERMQKRYREGHPQIDSIIQTGTETIIDEVNVLMNLLGEFSKFARLPEMKAEWQDLNRKIINCVNFFQGNENIIFHMDLAGEMPPMLLDKMLLRQAITNLIQNSVDAISGRGNIYVKTEVISVDRKPFARITIKDDGVGIREEDLDRVFEPTFSTKESGTEIGRASCRERV